MTSTLSRQTRPRSPHSARHVLSSAVLNRDSAPIDQPSSRGRCEKAIAHGSGLRRASGEKPMWLVEPLRRAASGHAADAAPSGMMSTRLFTRSPCRRAAPVGRTSCPIAFAACRLMTRSTAWLLDGDAGRLGAPWHFDHHRAVGERPREGWPSPASAPLLPFWPLMIAGGRSLTL